jgi:hypothetical protein
LGNQFIIDENVSNAAAKFSVIGCLTTVTDVFSLQGGLDDGIRQGGTVSSGTIGDSLVITQSQTNASLTLT